MTQENMNMRNSARELVDRLGGDAIAYVNERITKLSEQGTSPELDQAYRLLSEVERVIEEATP
jgi:hypothetical protein